MMKVTPKKLIEFRRKSDRSKITFAKNLLLDNQESEDGSGGDYWISCLSAIRNTFKYDKAELLVEKINLLNDKIKVSEKKNIKDQFQKNIDVLNTFKDYKFQYIKPNSDLKFIKQPKDQATLEIKGLTIESKPCHFFSFSQNGNEEIGGIWFVAKINGFKQNELGMFSEILYRYLDKNYSKDFYVNPNYCIAIDLYKGQEVRFTEIKEGKIPSIIESTVEEIKKIQKV